MLAPTVFSRRRKRCAGGPGAPNPRSKHRGVRDASTQAEAYFRGVSFPETKGIPHIPRPGTPHCVDAYTVDWLYAGSRGAGTGIGSAVGVRSGMQVHRWTCMGCTGVYWAGDTQGVVVFVGLTLLGNARGSCKFYRMLLRRKGWAEIRVRGTKADTWASRGTRR